MCTCRGYLFTHNGEIWSQMSFLIIQSLQNHRFDGLSCNILSRFFNVICKNLVSEINSNMHTSKKILKKKEEEGWQTKKNFNPKNNLSWFYCYIIKLLSVFNLVFLWILWLVYLDFIKFPSLDFNGLFTDRKIIETF